MQGGVEQQIAITCSIRRSRPGRAACPPARPLQTDGQPMTPRPVDPALTRSAASHQSSRGFKVPDSRRVWSSRLLTSRFRRRVAVRISTASAVRKGPSAPAIFSATEPKTASGVLSSWTLRQERAVELFRLGKEFLPFAAARRCSLSTRKAIWEAKLSMRSRCARLREASDRPAPRGRLGRSSRTIGT